MIDAIVDRLKGRRLVSDEHSAINVGDVYFDAQGVKWICTEAEPFARGWSFVVDRIEPVTFLWILKRVVFTTLTSASVVAPIYWFFWRTQ